jgi:hypothetical protein
MVYRLAALRRSAAARQNRYALGARKRDGAFRFGDRTRRHDAKRRHLVMGRVSRVPAAREAVEPYIAADFASETMFESGRSCYRHGFQGRRLERVIAKLDRPIKLVDDTKIGSATHRSMASDMGFCPLLRVERT